MIFDQIRIKVFGLYRVSIKSVCTLENFNFICAHRLYGHPVYWSKTKVLFSGSSTLRQKLNQTFFNPLNTKANFLLKFTNVFGQICTCQNLKGNSD